MGSSPSEASHDPPTESARVMDSLTQRHQERVYDAVRAEVNQGDGAISERTNYRFGVLAIVSSISRAVGGRRWLS